MADQKFRCNVEFRPYSNQYALRMMLGDKAATDLVFQKVEPGSIVDPVINLEQESAQELANALWAAGIRPEQSMQAQGAYDAQGKHLSDMRAIAFKQLKMKD